MQHIGLIVYPGFQVLGLAMCATFELTNNALEEPLYSIALLSEHGGMVQTSAGFAVETTAFDQRSFDTLLVMGDNVIRPVSTGMVEFLRQASRPPVASVRFAPAPLPWPRPVCWMAGARPLTGVTPRHCSGRIPGSRSKRTVYSSTMATSGPLRA
jgi:hypothetical protein